MASIKGDINPLTTISMKLLFFIFLVSLTARLIAQDLNHAIADAQKRSVRISPYRDARQRFFVHDSQLGFRLIKFPTAIKDFLLSSARITDTLWIAETFDDMCPSCSSFFAEIIYKGIFYYYNEMNDDTVSNKKFAAFALPGDKTTNGKFFMSVVDSVRSGHTWLSHPLTYGADDCGDGDHTLITVVYPDNHIEALYIRCWMRRF